MRMTKKQAEEIDLDEIDWDALDRANDRVGQDLGITHPILPPQIHKPDKSNILLGFTVTGRLQTTSKPVKEEVELCWQSGILTGDSEAVELAQLAGGLVSWNTADPSESASLGAALDLVLRYVFEPEAKVTHIQYNPNHDEQGRFSSDDEGR
jgi:hypothetical protein